MLGFVELGVLKPLARALFELRIDLVEDIGRFEKHK